MLIKIVSVIMMHEVADYIILLTLLLLPLPSPLCVQQQNKKALLVVPYVSLVLEKTSYLRRLWKDAPVSIFALYGSENAGAAHFCNESDEVTMI